MRVKAKHLVGWSIVLFAATALDAAGDLRLVEAAKNRQREAVRALLRQGVDVNASAPDGATALHWAAFRDDLDTADLLLREAANVNAVNQLGVAPLYLACENGSVAMVEALLKAGANSNAALPSGETALMTAARAGSVGAMRALIGRGADVNAREKTDGQTALMWAVSQQHPEVVEVLLGAGADVRARSDIRRQAISRGREPVRKGTVRGKRANIVEARGGFTPLLFASRVGDVRAARLLLAAGADVNDTTPEGATALVVAVHSGHTALPIFLLEQGANPNAADAGYSALHAAVLRDGDPPLMEALLAHGANPNATVTRGTVVDRQTKSYHIDGGLIGATPFFLAAKYADARAMRLLAAAGADPLWGLEDGSTPLMVAAGMLTDGLGRGGQDRKDRELDSAENDLAYGQAEDLRSLMNSGIEAVKLALELGADINAASETGDTALHSAASHGFKTVIQFLVSQGARLDAKNKRGQTPLMAVESRRESFTTEGKQIAATTAELIRKLGAKP